MFCCFLYLQHCHTSHDLLWQYHGVTEKSRHLKMFLFSCVECNFCYRNLGPDCQTSWVNNVSEKCKSSLWVWLQLPHLYVQIKELGMQNILLGTVVYTMPPCTGITARRLKSSIHRIGKDQASTAQGSPICSVRVLQSCSGGTKSRGKWLA